MRSWQKIAAKAMVSITFATGAALKMKAIAMLPVERTTGYDGTLMAVAAGLEIVLALLLWSRLSDLACWVGAGFVSIGSAAYPLLATRVSEGCRCLGSVYLSPIQHAGLALVLFVLCSMVLLDPQRDEPSGPTRLPTIPTKS